MWRLCGTLGIEFKTLTALKERKKIHGLAAVVILKCDVALYDSAFGLILSLFQSYALFVVGTQGSAKPPPWAEFRNRFAVDPTGSWAEFCNRFAVNPTGGRASLQTNLNRGFRLRRTFLLW